MTDNRTPTPGKNAWLARPRAYENETVNVERAAANAPDGYTRDVVLSLVIDEPGKGGKNPPRREIRTPMNHQDALTLAVHLAENGHTAERLNAEEGHNRRRKPYFSHPTGDPGRRMSRDFARVNERLARVVLDRLQLWQDQHRDVADYRVTGAIADLRKAANLLKYLADDTTPDMDAALRELERSGFFNDGEPGALTGHAPTDRHEGKLPRITATGRYFLTANRSIPVTVASADADEVSLTVTGDSAEEHPDGITVPRSELGSWLILDDPADWLPTDTTD